jgi:Flp pilus assembly protein TadG
MNSHGSRTQRGSARGHYWRSGQSAVELALIFPVVALFLVIAADFGRLFSTNVGLKNAARAGAQYGSQSVVTAADAAGMIAAAQKDAPSIASISATANQCTCQSGSSVAACATTYSTTYCTHNAQATYVIVTAQAPFHTLISYPGIPSSLTLSGQAVMQVQE